MKKAICIAVLGGWLGLPLLRAQPDNGQVCFQLLHTFFQTKGDTFRTVNTGDFPGETPPFHLDTTATRSLQVSEPEISFEKLGKDAYQRNVNLGVVVQDSTYYSEVLSYTDTLSLTQVRQVRRSGPRALRGDSPVLLARFGLPLGVITLSVAGVISLFYIRSR